MAWNLTLQMQFGGAFGAHYQGVGLFHSACVSNLFGHGGVPNDNQAVVVTRKAYVALLPLSQEEEPNATPIPVGPGNSMNVGDFSVVLWQCLSV